MTGTLNGSASGNGGDTNRMSAQDQANDPNIMHNFMFFYNTDLLIVPEFRFANKLDVIKKKDVDMLVESLNAREELERKLKEEEAANRDASGAPAKGGKADPKKDAKAKDKKGAPVADDKNIP